MSRRPLLGRRLVRVGTLLGLLVALTAAAAFARVTASPAPGSYSPIAGGRQVLLWFHVIGSGGYDPHTPGLQADYRAVAIPSDGGHYLASESQEQWFSWSALFPKDFPTQRGFAVFSAWKGLGIGFNSTPNVSFDVTDDILHLYTAGGNPGVIRNADGTWRDADNPDYGRRYERGFRLGPLPKGTWLSLLLHVRWSQDPRKGFVEVFESVGGGPNRLVLRKTAVSNLYDDWPAVRFPGQDLYHKGSANIGTVSDVYQTPMQWGPTMQAALTTPSRQVADGEWFGDTKSTGGVVEPSAAPVPLPSTIPYPDLGAAARAATTPNPPAARPKPQPGVVLGRDCTRCRVRVVGNQVAATIPGARDGSDTAYWVRRVGGSRGVGRLAVDDRIALGSGGALGGNLAVLQVRDAHSRLIVELYLAPDRSLHLWSPAGGLRTSPVNVPLGASVGEGAAHALPVQLSLLPRRALRVYAAGKLRLRMRAAARPGAVGPRFVRVGIDHYDGDSSAAVEVVHRGFRVAA